MIHLLKYSAMVTMMISCFLLAGDGHWKLMVVSLVSFVVMIISDAMIVYEQKEKWLPL